MEDSISKYPYFVLPMIEAYKNAAPDSELRLRIRERIAANIGDKCVLDRLIPPEPTFKADPEKDSSFDTIDNFLAKFGGNNAPLGYMRNLQEETDYSPENYSLEEDNPENKTASIKDKNISANTQPGGSVNDDNIARSLIKNKRYQEALEIIERQNLINPQKNIYFADQIRFLRKLIAIQNLKNKPEG